MVVCKKLEQKYLLTYLRKNKLIKNIGSSIWKKY